MRTVIRYRTLTWLSRYPEWAGGSFSLSAAAFSSTPLWEPREHSRSSSQEQTRNLSVCLSVREPACCSHWSRRVLLTRLRTLLFDPFVPFLMNHLYHISLISYIININKPLRNLERITTESLEACRRSQHLLHTEHFILFSWTSSSSSLHTAEHDSDLETEKVVFMYCDCFCHVDAFWRSLFC